MVTKEKERQPWFRITKDLAKDVPFFGSLGLIFGFIQFMGHRYFDNANLGSELLQEHLAFNSLLLLTMFVWAIKAAVARSPKLSERQTLTALIAHLVTRITAFGSVATSIILGFAASAAIFGAYFHAFKFAQASLYFASVAEIAANPVRLSEVSRGYILALAMVIATPFIF